MKITANRGEWAELYTLVKLILDNAVPSLDRDLKPIPGKLFKFLELMRQDDGAFLRFVPYDSPLTGETSERLPERSELADVLEAFWDEITTASGASFESYQGQKLMRALGIKKIKAKSSEKVDLYGRLAGLIGSDDSQLGFSIKSQVRAKSTLVNASGQTTFIYSVEGGNLDVDFINAIVGGSKIQDRVKAIYDSGAKLVFDGMNSEIFRRNLDLIESNLKTNLADLLIVAYLTDNKSVAAAIRALGELSDDSSLPKRISYQIKNFLRAAALGMVPGTEWDGDLTAYGGYLVVKKDGSIGCFHLQKDDEFKDYLLNNTKFDTPSGDSKRGSFGELFQTSEGLKFSLKMQVRFL